MKRKKKKKKPLLLFGLHSFTKPHCLVCHPTLANLMRIRKVGQYGVEKELGSHRKMSGI